MMCKRLVLLLWVLFSYGQEVKKNGEISDSKRVFQNAPLQLLLEGNYKGYNSIRELRKEGDFGLGTLDLLDGELIVLDGDFYQVDYDGKVKKVDDEWTTPFVVLTHFKPDMSFVLKELDHQALMASLLNELNPNKVYAIKIMGDFDTLKLRSVKAISHGTPFAKVIKNQAIFNFEKTSGVAVGYYFPAYYNGINAAGLHFHFLSKDRQTGGHVLNMNSRKVMVYLSELKQVRVDNPHLLNKKRILNQVEFSDK